MSGPHSAFVLLICALPLVALSYSLRPFVDFQRLSMFPGTVEGNKNSASFVTFRFNLTVGFVTPDEQGLRIVAHAELPIPWDAMNTEDVVWEVLEAPSQMNSWFEYGLQVESDGLTWMNPNVSTALDAEPYTVSFDLSLPISFCNALQFNGTYFTVIAMSYDDWEDETLEDEDYSPTPEIFRSMMDGTSLCSRQDCEEAYCGRYNSWISAKSVSNSVSCTASTEAPLPSSSSPLSALQISLIVFPPIIVVGVFALLCLLKRSTRNGKETKGKGQTARVSPGRAPNELEVEVTVHSGE